MTSPSMEEHTTTCHVACNNMDAVACYNNMGVLRLRINYDYNPDVVVCHNMRMLSHAP